MSSEANLDERLSPLRATIVEYENAPNECTIHPLDPPDSNRTTEWITAREGSYLHLRDCR
ncbi:DUF7511 domain-containing protein [Halobellus rufus]|uniref:DUF7511 domain-containing protein n=1 Tax=Halobellus rufus TaxID=1448860 RepID=UPI0006797091|nr:hypothetical protein [Halobellus rufus]